MGCQHDSSEDGVKWTIIRGEAIQETEVVSEALEKVILA
jgi:hypothetical protein